MIRLDSVGLSCYPYAGARRAVLRGISLAVPEGGFRWLIGPSGAGKTSLLHLLSLAARPTEGQITLLGTKLDTARRRDLPALRRRIGVVFQDFRLLPHLTVFDNVALPLRLAGRPEGAVRADVADMLNWVGLGACGSHQPAFLSGGEQQRVAAARAVIARPALLLADEPTSNLDAAQADRLIELLRELNRIGTTVVIATHSRVLVDRHPAHELHLRDGALVSGNG